MENNWNGGGGRTQFLAALNNAGVLQARREVLAGVRGGRVQEEVVTADIRYHESPPYR